MFSVLRSDIATTNKPTRCSASFVHARLTSQIVYFRQQSGATFVSHDMLVQMTVDEWFVRTESACDRTEIEKLQAEAFGPGRFARTAFRIREGVACSPTLSLVAFRNDQLAGSIRLSPILIGSSPAMLLGPLTVAPAFKNQGLGKLLLRTTLEQAQAEGESAVLLVGDAGYYAPCGFQLVPHGTIRLPGPVDPARLLIALFGGFDMPAGSVRADAKRPRKIGVLRFWTKLCPD